MSLAASVSSDMDTSMAPTDTSLFVKLRFVRAVTELAVGCTVDIDAMMKVAHAYGEATFTSNTTSSLAASTRVMARIDAITRSERERYAASPMIASVIGAAAAPTATNAGIEVDGRAFRTTRGAQVAALWVLHHPHAQLAETFMCVLQGLEDGVDGIETLMGAAARALTKENIDTAVRAFNTALLLHGTCVPAL